LSHENKLLIRCAWAGNSAFASAGYGSGWGSGTCPATFTTKASLQTAVQAYNTNPDTATGTYGSIAGWDVSRITDMSYLFNNLENFNADISSWDTSKVTNMYAMFWVRSARALTSKP
jgi:surface protein